MPNDITTLNGALRQLGETMASNLTTQGVPSTYDEGLTTLAGKILDIQGGGGVRTLTLTSDKDILSYADSESATLTATLLEDGVAVSGATVEFFNGSTSMGTAQTDSNGVATKIYTSTGAGDVSLKAEVDNGMILIQTYSIEDCTYYSTTEYNSESSLSIDLPSAPFSIEFDIKPTSRSTSGAGSSGYLAFGESWATNKTFRFGQFTSAGRCAIDIYGGTASYFTNDSVLNTDNHFKFSFDGTNYVAEYSNEQKTGAKGSFNVVKIVRGMPTSNNHLKNIKIKPL